MTHQSLASKEAKKPDKKRRMHKVSPLLRAEERGKNLYDPLVVSFGPYHHGKPELRFAEDFKPKAVELFVEGSGKTRDFFHGKILEVVGGIRSCYLEGTTAEFSDEELADLVLRDACFMLNYVEIMYSPDVKRKVQHKKITTHYLDRLVIKLTLRDMILLENQLPYSILKLLANLRFGEEEGDELLSLFISKTYFREKRDLKSKLNQENPFHLLDAIRSVLVAEREGNEIVTNPSEESSQGGDDFLSKLKAAFPLDGDSDTRHFSYLFRSVTDLRAKGVTFKLSSSCSLKDINFVTSGDGDYLSGELQLPYWSVSIFTRISFSNLIAYENCLESSEKLVVSAYVLLMKALIQSPGDVAELQEKKVLVNTIGSNEEVVEVFRDLNTFTLGDKWVFDEVSKKMQHHFSRRQEVVEMAEMVRTGFAAHGLTSCSQYKPSCLC